MPVDEIKYKGKRLKYNDYDAIPFGFDKKLNAKIGHPGTSHKANGINIEYDKYTGRLWKDSKIITFWNYPDINTMKILLNKLEKDLNINFSDWLIEIWVDKKGDHESKFSYGKIADGGIKNKIIPIPEYIGSEDTPEKFKINHLKTLEEKERERKQKIKDGTFKPWNVKPGKIPIEDGGYYDQKFRENYIKTFKSFLNS